MTPLAAVSLQAVGIVLSVVLSGGSLAGIAALFLLPANRLKLGAEREQIKVASQVSLAGGYGELVGDLRAEITRLQASQADLRGELGACRLEVAKLRTALAEFGRTINGT